MRWCPPITLIEAWTSLKSFVPKDGSGKPLPDWGSERRSNDTHPSTADPEARLYKNAEGDRLCYLGRALMENRNADLETTLVNGTAKREAAKTMVARTVTGKATLGADKGYDVAAIQNVTPHVVQKKRGSAIDGRTNQHTGYAQSLKRRKLAEEIFGSAKTVGGLRKTPFIGLAKVKAQTVFTFAAYNPTRMATIFGWRLNST